MSRNPSIGGWCFVVNAKIIRPAPSSEQTGKVAAMFGLAGGHCEVLYDRFRVAIRPGQIVAAVGPSGAGKSVLLRQAAAQCPDAIELRAGRLSRQAVAAAEVLKGGRLAQRLEILSRCGLAEAAALITPARDLSGGQLHRLALAEAIFRARRRGRPTLIIADEFAANLDDDTAAVLSRQVRKLISGWPLAMLVATARQELLEWLCPDRLVIKPIAEPAFLTVLRRTRAPCGGWADPRRWRIVRGSIRDYDALAGFHYLAGRPAAHKRVYVVRPPRNGRNLGRPRVAGVLVVSPPVTCVRGRNVATAGRYADRDRGRMMARLNAEMECISRVIVHPIYRSSGLALRLVRHALADAQTPLTEALAAMGMVHPMFELAGMTCFGRYAGRTQTYSYYLAQKRLRRRGPGPRRG